MHVFVIRRGSSLSIGAGGGHVAVRWVCVVMDRCRRWW